MSYTESLLAERAKHVAARNASTELPAIRNHNRAVRRINATLAMVNNR